MQAMQQQEAVLHCNFDSWSLAGQPLPLYFFLGCRMESVVMRRDHLGYYNALGLEPGAASLPAIKEAFRQAALMWHPDRQKVRPRSDLVVRLKMLLLLKAKFAFHEQSVV